MSKHPLQTLVETDGVIRFRQNPIIYHLVDSYPGGLNALAEINYGKYNFEDGDWEQLAQLIGYSVSAFGGLDYTSDETVAEADRLAESMMEEDEEPAVSSNDWKARYRKAAKELLETRRMSQRRPAMSDELKQVAQLEGDLEEACRDVDHKRVAQMNKVLLQMTITLIKERDEARAEATVKRLMLEQYKEEVAAHLSCGYCGWGPLWVNAHCSPTCAKASKEASKEDSGEQ